MNPESRLRGTRGLAIGLAAVLAVLGAMPVAALDPSRAVTQYQSEVWTSQRGLPGNSVNWLAQDAAGYLIVGTSGRAALFDGERFRRLAPEIGFEPRLRAHASDGTEWFVGSSIARRGPDGIVVNEGPFDETFEPKAVYADTDGALLIGGSSGLARLTAGSTSLVIDSGIEGPVCAIFRDSSGVLYAAGRSGLSRKAEDERWEIVPGTEDATVFNGIETREGAIWLATDRGVIVLHRDGHTARFDQSNGIPAGRVRAIIEDRDANVWAGMESNGLVRFAGDRVDLLGISGGLPSLSIRTLLEDSDGNVWVGMAGGLVRLSNSRFLGIGTSEGLRSNLVLSLTAASDGDLWIGTSGGGLAQVRTGTLVRNYGAAEGLTDPVVQSVLQTSDGGILVGTRSGVFVLTGSRLQAVGQLADVAVSCLEESRDGSILVGAPDGLRKWSGSRVVSYDAPPGQAITSIRAIVRAREGGDWIGGDGLGHFDGERLERLHARELDGPIYDVYEEKGGVLWLATSPGIVRIEDGRVTKIDVPAAIDHVVHAIAPDNNRHFWLPTNSGLVRADRDQLEAFARGAVGEINWTTFREIDGLPGGEFSGSSGQMWARDRDGRLWFASVAGAVSIDPATPFTPQATPARLELVRSEDKHLVQRGERLAADQRRRLEFRYTVVNLSTSGQTRFRYRLEPIDESWVDAGHSRDAVYRNLPPGTYRFRVEAAGRDGVFLADPSPFPVSIEPYIYERTSVRIGAALLLIGAILAIPLARERRMREQQAELQRLVQKKTNELMKANTELALVSRTDTLTGLLNRRDFDDRAEHEVSRVNRGHGAFAVVLVDVDHFRQINDKFGHATGDLLLAHVAGVLIELTRRQDVVGRWAGEQFILLLPDTAIKGAELLADKIRSSIEHADYSAYRGPESLTATFGVTSYQAGETLEEAVHRAELAIDEGKSSGRNRVVRRL